MRKYDRLTWIVLGGILSFALYLVSYHPLRAAEHQFPALNRPLVQAAFEPARRIAECESLSGPMRWWARVWGQRTRCQPGLKNLGLALHNYRDANGSRPTSTSDDSGPSQFPPID